MLFLNNANKRQENAPYRAQVRRFAVSLHYTRAKYRDKNLIQPHVCLTIADMRLIIFCAEPAQVLCGPTKSDQGVANAGNAFPLTNYQRNHTENAHSSN